MYKGESTDGLELYNLLMESVEFTSELGKVALASVKLEAEFIALLTRKNVKGNYTKATLGTLIKKAEESNLLDQNEIQAFKLLSKQRNYLTHNIYALFNGQIDETILERQNLLDSDVYLYQERAWQLKENIEDITDIIKRKN
jgi:hypothetical protein